MIRIALCDDEADALERCERRLGELAQEADIPIQISTFADGKQLLLASEGVLREMDILFLDVRMRHLSGIEVGALLKSSVASFSGLIIYLSSSKEYAFDAFRAAPFSYLVKDDLYSDKFRTVFFEALGKARRDQHECFVVNTRHAVVSLPLHDILYFESNRKKVIARTARSSASFYGTLGEVSARLQGRGFLRCHKSFLVNCEAVRSFGSVDVTLVDGRVLSLGRKYAGEFKAAFLGYLRNTFVL